MPIWLFSTIFAGAVIVTLVAGIWLLLHLTALARTVEGHADVVASPKPPRTSRGTIRFALILFAAALLLTLAMQILAMTGVANLVAD